MEHSIIWKEPSIQRAKPLLEARFVMVTVLFAERVVNEPPAWVVPPIVVPSIAPPVIATPEEWKLSAVTFPAIVTVSKAEPMLM
jgi:hypothetical protein